MLFLIVINNNNKASNNKFSLATLQPKRPSRFMKKAGTIQYGNRKWGTRA